MIAFNTPLRCGFVSGFLTATSCVLMKGQQGMLKNYLGV